MSPSALDRNPPSDAIAEIAAVERGPVVTAIAVSRIAIAVAAIAVSRIAVTGIQPVAVDLSMSTMIVPLCFATIEVSRGPQSTMRHHRQSQAK
jgi:hypothetical protein